MCSDKLAFCHPEVSPEASKTGEPAAKIIRTTQRIGDLFTTEKFKFTANTKKIITEPSRLTDMDQQQIERFLRKELPKSQVASALSRHPMGKYNLTITHFTPSVGCSWTDKRMKKVETIAQRFPDFEIINDHLYRHLLGAA